MSHTIKELYEAYQRDIYGYLLGLTHSKTVAEDLTSEVFLSAIKALPRFQGKSEIKTWLFSIARHKWYEYLRQEKKHPSGSDVLSPELADEGASPEERLLRDEAFTRLTQLLDQEPERSRTVLFLRLDGYSFYEIGQIRGISENSARVIAFRVRKKLKELLAKEGFSGE